MNATPVDPRQLDVAAFAKAGGELAGAWPVSGFDRLLDALAQEALDPGAEVVWSARGERRESIGVRVETWLRLGVSTTLPLVCQRCLAPVGTAIAFERRILFVAGADEAERLDDELEEDVMVLPRTLDLHALVEDELLLGLPLVPRHEACPTVLPNAAVDELEDEPAPNPFAALAGWKRERPLN